MNNLGFHITEYTRDLLDIAKYSEKGSDFEASAIYGVADYHGQSPEIVKVEVDELREMLNRNKTA